MKYQVGDMFSYGPDLEKNSGIAILKRIYPNNQTEVQWIICKRDYKNEHFGDFGSTFFTVKELINSPDWKKLS
jgi:hypothetical protein